jgi:hypothetical protein
VGEGLWSRFLADFWTDVWVFVVRVSKAMLKEMGFRSNHERRLCAFCGTEHAIYRKSHVSFFDVVVCAFAGLLVMAPFANSLDPRGIAIGAVFIGFTELFVSLRHRMSLKCGRCGFDPVIYRRSQEQAAKLVREHLARRAANPAHLLSEPVMAAGQKSARDKARRLEKSRREQLDSTQHP